MICFQMYCVTRLEEAAPAAWGWTRVMSPLTKKQLRQGPSVKEIGR